MKLDGAVGLDESLVTLTSATVDESSCHLKDEGVSVP